MPYTVFDVTSGVYARIGLANIPSFLSVGSINELANDRLNYIAQQSALSFGSGDIPSRLLQPLRDMTSADVIAARQNTDVDVEASLGGNVSVSYSAKSQANQKLIDFFLARADQTLRMQGMRITSNYTTKAR